MKVFTNCPNCNGKLIENQVVTQTYNPISEFMNRCENKCELNLFQFYNKTFDGIKLTCMSFRTANFDVYVYTEIHNIIQSRIHIYPYKDNQNQSKLSFNIPLFEIDFHNLGQYNDRWKLWTTFS
jgi:hypothetical protein